MIHLDTSFLIIAIRDNTFEQRLLEQWLDAGETIGMSSVAWYEFHAGPLDDRSVEFAREMILQPIPLTGEDAELAARFFNFTNRRRSSMGDCMIAATAVRHSAKVATCNTADFRRFDPYGLILA